MEDRLPVAAVLGAAEQGRAAERHNAQGMLTQKVGRIDRKYIDRVMTTW